MNNQQPSQELTKKCKHCQSDIPKKANVCPVCKKKQKRPVLGIAIAVLGILILASALGGKKDTPQKVTNNNADSQSSTVTADTAEENTTFKVGDTAEYKGVLVTLNSIKESEGSDYNTPTDGNVFLLANFTIENNTDSDLVVSSLLSFSAYQDGYATNLSLSALIEKEGEQLDGTIAPGKKMQGSIGYEVPADYSEFEINYQSDIWDNMKFCFVYTK